MEMDKQLIAAQNEWNAVATVTIAAQIVPSEGGDEADPVKALSTPSVSSPECVDHFRGHTALNTYKRHIKPVIQYTGLRSCLHVLFGPPSLRPELDEDRDLLFAMAAWQFDNEDPVHSRMLQTVYRELTLSKIDPPRYGSHWDDIGFQGTDPATDLRGGGCLGLVNLVYLTTNVQYKEIAQLIYTLSRDARQNFPFSVMSLNITSISLKALRGQLLNKESNKTRDVISTFNRFYAACYLHLYTLWSSGYKTIHHSGHVLKETETYCCKNVSRVLKTLESYELRKNEGSDKGAVTAAFTNLDKIT